MADPEPRITTEEALRYFNIVKSDPRSHPHSVQLAWERYCQLVEKDMQKRDTVDVRS